APRLRVHFGSRPGPHGELAPMLRSPIRRFLRLSFALAVMLAATLPAAARARRQNEAREHRTIAPEALDALPEDAPKDGTGPGAAAAAAFRGRHAGTWRVTFHRRPARP